MQLVELSGIRNDPIKDDITANETEKAQTQVLNQLQQNQQEHTFHFLFFMTQLDLLTNMSIHNLNDSTNYWR